MKKIIRVVFWASIGVIIIKMGKTFFKIRSYTKFAVFGGINEKFETIELTDKSYATIFGGVNIDLRKVTLPQTGTTINIYSRFGGVNIKLPKNWNVTMEGTSKHSEIRNVAEFDIKNKTAPQLKIVHDLKFSGMNISIPKAESSLTEKLEKTD